MRGRRKGVVETAPRFRWSAADQAELERLYLGLLLGPRAISRRMGPPFTEAAVQGRIVRERLASRLPEGVRAARRQDALDRAVEARHARRARLGKVVWTADAWAVLRRCYLVEDVPPALIARRLGFPPLAVRRKIRLTGLYAERRALGKGRLRARNLDQIPGLVVTRLAMGATAGPDERQLASLARAHANSRRTRELRMTAADVLRLGGAEAAA